MQKHSGMSLYLRSTKKLEPTEYVDARIINHGSKWVNTLEMSCPWVTNREKNEEEKNTKYK